MDFDRIPPWLKAFAASLWIMFVLAPLIAWMAHRFGDAAVWAMLPAWAIGFCIVYARSTHDDIPDAEFYRRKARAQARPDLI